MKRLFILGNGFDRYFNLPTSVDDFLNELKKVSCIGSESAFDTYARYGVEWGDFEEALAEIILDEIDEDTIQEPDYLSDHEYDREGVIWSTESFTQNLYDSRNIAFTNMLQKAEEKLGYVNQKYNRSLFDDKNDFVINFNYTSTVETLFNYSRTVFHIHGSIDNPDELIFGFKNENQGYYDYKKKTNAELNNRLKQEIQRIKENDDIDEKEKDVYIENLTENYDNLWNDYYIDQQYERILEFYEMNKKQFQYEQLSKYLFLVGQIEQVVVLGHSLAEVDSEYFELMEKYLNPKEWIVSVRDVKKLDDKRLSKYNQYSFFKKIEFVNLCDVVG